MSRRTLSLLIAAVIAAFTALSVKNRLSQTPPEEPVVQASRVLIAKHDLSPGSFVQASQDLDWGALPTTPPPPPPADENADNAPPKPAVAIPPDTIPKESYLYENSVKLADFNGAVVRRQLHGGAPVPASALMKAGAGGLLSAVLNPGMRAVSISVPPNTNGAPFVSGFVLPGDYVDLIVTREIDFTGQSGRVSASSKTVFSKTFVEDVRVLAADQALDNPDNKALQAKTITVEVTPEQAQEIAVATEMGKISVSLRSAVKEETPGGAVEAIHGVSDLDMSLFPKSKSMPQAAHQQVKLFRPNKDAQSLEFERNPNDGSVDSSAIPADQPDAPAAKVDIK